MNKALNVPKKEDLICWVNNDFSFFRLIALKPGLPFIVDHRIKIKRFLFLETLV